MKLTALLSCLAAVFLGAFGAWGVYTAAGRRRFDEMAGIIPMGALALAGLAGVVAIVLMLVAGRSR